MIKKLGPKAEAALTKVRQLFETLPEADLVLGDLARGLASDQKEDCLAALRTCKQDAIAFGVDLDEFATRFGKFLVAWIDEAK
jgi:hypothetical protein